MSEVNASDEMVTTLLTLSGKMRELKQPDCKLPKNRTIRNLALELGKTAKRLPVQEVLNFISSDTFFAYAKAEEVLATFKALQDGEINVEFKDANGMSINNPNYKEEPMSKVDDILGAGDNFDDVLGGLDLESSEQKVEAMRDGGGEAIEVGAGDNDCGDGCKI